MNVLRVIFVMLTQFAVILLEAIPVLANLDTLAQALNVLVCNYLTILSIYALTYIAEKLSVLLAQ